MATALRNTLGVESEEWAAVRSAAWSNLLTPADNAGGLLSPQQIATNITGFINGRGEGLSAVLFSAEERDLMRQFANTMRLLVPDPGATNPSRTSYGVSRIMTPIVIALAASLGTDVGGFLGAMTAVMGQQFARAGTRALAVRRALDPNAAQPLFRDPAAAGRVLTYIMQTGNLLVTPRATTERFTINTPLADAGGAKVAVRGSAKDAVRSNGKQSLTTRAEMIPPSATTTGPMTYYHAPRQPMTADRFAARFAGTGSISPNQSTAWMGEQQREGGMRAVQTRLSEMLAHIYRLRTLNQSQQ